MGISMGTPGVPGEESEGDYRIQSCGQPLGKRILDK